MLDMLGAAAFRTVLLAGAVQCLLWLLRVRQARLLLAAWTVVLAASMAMPLLPRIAPLRVPLDPALPGTLIAGAAGLMPQPSLPALPAVPPLGDAGPEGQAAPPLRTWLEAVYLVVCCGIGLRVLLGMGLSLRLLARAVPLRLDGAAGMRVRISRDIAGPVTIGHVVVLPIDAVGWSDGTRRAVLAHEQAHVARYDFALLILSQLNRALFWFSPLPWWLHRRLIALTELASDDQAMACTRDRLGYAEILLEMGRRAGPVPRGPAMARLSTLPQRIDRILLDQAGPPFSSRPQRLMLTAGVAGLSLAVASVTPGWVPTPPTIPLAPQPDVWNDAAVGRSGRDAGVGEAIGQATEAQTGAAPEKAAPVTPPPAVGETGPEARLRPASALPPPSRAAPRTPPVKAAVLPTPRAMATPRRVAPGQEAGQGETEVRAVPQSFGGTATRSYAATEDDAANRSGRLATIDAHAPLPRQFSDGSLSAPPPAGFEAVAGSSCTGTLEVGLRAWQGSFNRQPDVVAGQVIPVQAQFFRRANGTPWVRFNVFGRPPLDLPVRFARAGMTWTGEYGISYTVRNAGDRRLTGLAALIANDSATLDLACATSVNRLF